jgi:hypothetical protein
MIDDIKDRLTPYHLSYINLATGMKYESPVVPESWTVVINGTR